MQWSRKTLTCAILGFVVFASLQTNVSALNCYQCTGTDSNNPFQCNEWLSDYDLEPQSCDAVYDAKYCIKRTGRYEVTALKCYQCTSGKTMYCSDGLIHSGALEPESCDHVFEAQYCIKSIGLDGGIGAMRFCSSLDLGNYCNYVRQPGDIMDYRSCVYTCTGDGCNSGISISSNFIFISIISLLISAFRFF